ncbi:MAG: SoxR reducing system RseC family protein [Treponema sp.]|jgi:positive regulator of sigma E activity|nr:SoxR reducing system RseC family protein [Treponema sp.]
MTGRVHALSETAVTISQGTSSFCFGCMQHECKTKMRLFTAENPMQLPLVVGHEVEVKTSHAMLARQALAALFPPFLGFIGGFMFTRFLVPVSGDPARAAGGVLGLFALAYLTYRIRKKHPATMIFQVVRII